MGTPVGVSSPTSVPSSNPLAPWCRSTTTVLFRATICTLKRTLYQYRQYTYSTVRSNNLDPVTSELSCFHLHSVVQSITVVRQVEPIMHTSERYPTAQIEPKHSRLVPTRRILEHTSHTAYGSPLTDRPRISTSNCTYITYETSPSIPLHPLIDRARADLETTMGARGMRLLQQTSLRICPSAWCA
ncbi:hypothetical protein BGX38DRAFT_380262 [Terfezia claveryi]|nr:hypothetical protein BGX38DRAFT_380262 [Terfezia claveryi]